MWNRSLLQDRSLRHSHLLLRLTCFILYKCVQAQFRHPFRKKTTFQKSRSSLLTLLRLLIAFVKFGRWSKQGGWLTGRDLVVARWLTSRVRDKGVSSLSIVLLGLEAIVAVN
jgi:hypothetical protein